MAVRSTSMAFKGGQLPPKSSIREIRINQNPFSAEFNRIGYGRIEILTKPGSDKFSGHIGSFGSTSALNTANPLVQEQPSYYLYSLQGDVNGPMTKTASYFFNAFDMQRQNQSIVVAVNPNDTTTTIQQALPNPSSFLYVNPRVDFQLGQEQYVDDTGVFFTLGADGQWAGWAESRRAGVQQHGSTEWVADWRFDRRQLAFDQ